MQQPQTRSPAADGYISTNGAWVDAARWERRRIEAASAVRRRLLTLREACELYGMTEDDIPSIPAQKH